MTKDKNKKINHQKLIDAVAQVLAYNLFNQSKKKDVTKKKSKLLNK